MKLGREGKRTESKVKTCELVIKVKIRSCRLRVENTSTGDSHVLSRSDAQCCSPSVS